MPDINGLELIQFIRKSEHHRATSRSSSSRPSPRSAIARAGSRSAPTRYLAKPFTPEELRERGATRLLASRRGSRRRGERPMADMGDKARDEFFSEAQEIVEGLARDLLALDDGRARGPRRSRARQRRLPRRAHAEGARRALRRATA